VRSIKAIQGLLEVQLAVGIDSRRVVLMGFSQGASLSMMTAFTVASSTGIQLGGVVSLSGWIPPLAKPMFKKPEHPISVLWTHGTADDKIPISMAQDGVSFLCQVIQPNEVRLVTYGGLGHETNAEELQDVVLWLGEVVPEAWSPQRYQIRAEFAI